MLAFTVQVVPGLRVHDTAFRSRTSRVSSRRKRRRELQEKQGDTGQDASLTVIVELNKGNQEVFEVLRVSAAIESIASDCIATHIK